MRHPGCVEVGVTVLSYRVFEQEEFAIRPSRTVW